MGAGQRAEEKSGKQAQESATGQARLLDNIPHDMPALTRADKLQKRCATVGFEWPDVGGALAKVREEIDEVEHELAQGEVDHQAMGEELGDLFFALVNVTRYLQYDPEAVLRAANRKFERRFATVESLTRTAGRTLEESSLAQMDALWDQVKLNERKA